VTARRDVELALLADHIDAIPVLAAGYEAEWGFWYGPAGRADATTDLVARAQREGMPLGLVALDRDIAIGAAALAENAIAFRPELSPVLIGLWVSPSHRGRGVATAILACARSHARRLGFAQLYATTTNVPEFFRRAGWSHLQKGLHNGEAVDLFVVDSAAGFGRAVV
jgi:GNAT superfamily N-acetyltransferase